MIYAAPGASFETDPLQGGPGTYFLTGMTGTIGVRIGDGIGGTTVARQTTGIVEQASGIYVATLTAPTVAGQYVVVWDDGSGNFANGGTLVVTYSTSIATAIANGADLVTLSEAKAQLETTASASDTLIGLLITSASRVLANTYEREFCPKATATRRFRVDGFLVNLAPFDLRTVTSMTLHPEDTVPQVLPSSSYSLAPLNGSMGSTYTRVRLAGSLDLGSTFASDFGYSQLDIAGGWGMFDTGDVTAELKRACIITVGAWLDRAVAQYTDGSFDERGLRPLSMGTWAIPSAAHRILEPWGRVVI